MSYYNNSPCIFIMYFKKKDNFSDTRLDSRLHVDHLAAPTAVKKQHRPERPQYIEQ